jgi:hypothetical protein
MADQNATDTTFENPLIPNAKLRQIYAAMVRLRALGEALASRSRKAGLNLGDWHACLVSTSVDLGPQDVASDASLRSDTQSRILDFLRGDPAEAVLNPEQSGAKRPRRKTLAECSSAGRLPAGVGIQERIWAAIGAAGAAKAKTKALKAAGTALEPSGVAVTYVGAEELATRLWRKVLAYASIESLPILFIVLPADSSGRGPRTGTTSAIALQHGIPGMAVDCEDAVAIYRVAQEAIGRARDGGGPALIECVHFVIDGTKSARTRADAIAALEQYMLSRGVATRTWMEGEARAFRKRIGLKDLHPKK